MRVPRKQADWGAHACSVLAVAFRNRELFPHALPAQGAKEPKESSFRQNAETSTLQACAPQNSAKPHLAPSEFVGRLKIATFP
jgi:hypothetical protein